MESIIVIVVAQLALVPLWLGLRHWSRPAAAVVGCAVILAAAGAVAWTLRTERLDQSRRRLDQVLPRQTRDRGFVSSDSCQACHPSQYASWHASYHRTMTQPALPVSVLGNFENEVLASRGRTYRLSRRSDEYWVTVAEPKSGRIDGETTNRRVVMTTGSHHMQAYWLPAGKGNVLEQLPFVWLNEDRRWVGVDDTLLSPPDTHSSAVWNMSCIRCHSVAGQPAFDPQSATADTRVAELGISCEACHGPAEEHVRVNRDPLRRYEQYRDGRPDPTIVHPGRCSPRQSAQICGQCHGVSQFTDRQLIEGDLYRAGDDLEKEKRIVRPSQIPADVQQQLRRQSATFLDGRFWPDGMVRVSGREYNGLIESACHVEGGLSCLSCHSMHDSDPNDQLIRSMQGNQACTQCHEEYQDNIEAHTHHAADSSGSNCYNCHMPHTTYGLLKAIRSHQIDSPNVATTLSTGRPNACNQCHMDRTLGWTAGYLSDWYGAAPVELNEEQQSTSAFVLDLLSGDAGQRVLAAWSAGWSDAKRASGADWLPPLLAPLLDDPYSAVRYVAYRSLRPLPGYADFEYDYVGPVGQRKAKAREARRMWDSSAPASRSPRGAGVLQDERGGLDQNRMERLIGNRNDRPVHLLE